MTARKFSTALAFGLTVFGVGPATAADVTYPIVDTGQTSCYGTGRESGPQPCPAPGRRGYGQDAQYTINPPHYVDNGDGTITDTVTGLMWQKEFTRRVSFAGAADVAARADTGGYHDWRVPTTKELYSLIDFRGTTGSGPPQNSRAPADAVPFIDTRVFAFEYATTGRFIDSQYVTRTAYKGRAMGQPAFFGVNFADGRIKGYPQSGGPGADADGGRWYARFVRGNPAYGRNAFHDLADGVVRDTATGLDWMRADSGEASLRGKLGHTYYHDGRMDWPEALAFCEDLTWGGENDWRLPSAKELHSILDYARSPSATRSAAIDPVFQATAITDERGKRNFPGYWTSTTLLDGRIKGSDAIVVYFGEALGAPAFGPGRGQGMGPGMGRQGMGPGMGGQGMGGQGMGPGMMGPGQGRPPFPPGGGRGMTPPDGMGQGMGEGMRPPEGMGPGTGMGQGPGMGPGMGPETGSTLPASAIIDVHGAGAQRSDPKTGDPDAYPSWGHGPQGDVRRVYNFVRCVRGG